MVNVVYVNIVGKGNTSNSPISEIDYVMVRKSLLSARTSNKSLNSREKAFNKLCVSFLKKIVAPQFANTYKLNLSNDGPIAEVLKCTKRQVKSVRERLSTIGVLFVPEWARQRKLGDYPIWMLNFKFTKFIDSDVENKSLNSKYNAQYHSLLKQATINVFKAYESMYSWTQEDIDNRIDDLNVEIGKYNDILNSISDEDNNIDDCKVCSNSEDYVSLEELATEVDVCDCFLSKTNELTVDELEKKIEELEKAVDETVDDFCSGVVNVPVREFMTSRWAEFNNILLENNLTREQLLK